MNFYGKDLNSQILHGDESNIGGHPGAVVSAPGHRATTHFNIYSLHYIQMSDCHIVIYSTVLTALTNNYNERNKYLRYAIMKISV